MPDTLYKDTAKKPFLCIIPARKNSKRLKNKNKKLLGGKPLIQWTIEAAFESEIFDMIVVSSDDSEILELTFDYFYTEKMQPHKRPPALCADDVPLKVVARFIWRIYGSGEHLCILQPDSPLRTAEDIKSAYKLFRDNDADFLVSVSRIGDNPADYDDGAITFARVKSFAQMYNTAFYGGKCVQYLNPHSLEIHTKEDLERAECLLSS